MAFALTRFINQRALVQAGATKGTKVRPHFPPVLPSPPFQAPGLWAVILADPAGDHLSHSSVVSMGRAP